MVRDAPFALEATATSGLPVTYESSDLAVALVRGNEVEIIAVGTITITARQPGNAVFMEALPVSQTLDVKSPDLVLGTDFFSVERDLIAPNPVSSWAMITLGDDGGKLPITVRVVDSYGRLLMERSFEYGEETKLNLSTLLNGIYFLQIKSSSNDYSTRIAVIH